MDRLANLMAIAGINLTSCCSSRRSVTHYTTAQNQYNILSLVGYKYSITSVFRTYGSIEQL